MFKTPIITIDASTASRNQNTRYRGLGMVSGNNSSRLLLDYKSEHPKRYQEIMNLIFGKDALGITHLKLEMGADINSSSGTEPAVKRSREEKADTTRGAGYQLAADAKKINPDLTLDMLWWSEPRWITDSADTYAARYEWYRETLCSAYETYRLVFDYVSANRNEREVDPQWIKYLSDHLKSETDCPYDFSKIKIVASDEVGTWKTAEKMLEDPALMKAIDVVGSHYTSHSDKHVRTLIRDYGKEIWFSEGCAPMSYSQGTYRFDNTGSGFNDVNGLLDIANRIIAMYPCGGMTLYEFQPVVSAYYDGVSYCQKQLITANTPWSGYYFMDNGFYMSLHFSRFLKKGWTFIDSACYSDGSVGGDGHAIVNATYSYVTACSPDTGDYSTVITNTTPNPITYCIKVSNLKKSASAVSVWETKGSGKNHNDENYFRKIGTQTPQRKNNIDTYCVTVQPYSIITVSTILSDFKERYPLTEESDNTILALPYEDDFSYTDYPADYLSKRGYAPRYTTDEGGAFEVCGMHGQQVLMQIITPDTKADEWGDTPNPVTNFGDDRWFQYSICANITFAKSNEPDQNYAGVGLRYNLGTKGESGWWLALYESGVWKLNKHNQTKAEGICPGLQNRTNLKIEAIENTVRAYINDILICEYHGDIMGEAMPSAGRAALYSSYHQNCFANVRLEPVSTICSYINRYNDTDPIITYNGPWTHTTMDSFLHYKRTLSKGTSGCQVQFSFTGTGFALTGPTEHDCTILVEADGNIITDEYLLPRSIPREAYYHKYGLPDQKHTVTITVLSGTLSLDSIETL